MARKGPRIAKVCVICGKPFKVFPSDTKQCCSKKCGAALRTKNGHRGGKWCLDAKIKYRESEKAKKAREENLKKATAVANSMPKNKRGSQNRTALVWILIDPCGQYHTAVNLMDWGRENKDLFFSSDVDEDTASKRISNGFKAIASSMRGVKSRERPVRTYKGWKLACLPMSKKPGDESRENKEE